MQRPNNSHLARQRTVTLKNSKLRGTFNLIDAGSQPVPSKKRGASSAVDNDKQQNQSDESDVDQIKRSGNQIKTPGVAVGDQKMTQCRKCGRSFASNRMAVHQRACMADITPPLSHNTPSRSLDQTYQITRTSQAGVLRESRQPKFVFCYICGRQFTDASLPIHEPQCLQKWQVQNDKLPRSERRPLPKKPEILGQGGADGMTREELQEAQWQAAKANMIACHSCGRRFATDRINTHERICKNVKHRPAPPPLGVTVQLNKNSTTAPSLPADSNGNSTLAGGGKIRESRQPKFVFCYICGRQFTDASLPIHEPQCLQKWQVQNDKLPRSERRPLPKKPEILGQGGAAGLSREQLQEAQWQAAKANLVECPNCARRFAPDRIHIHKRICKVPAKQKQATGTDLGTNDDDTGLHRSEGRDKEYPAVIAVSRQAPRSAVCYLCGREFGSKSIAIHVPQCLQKWHIENNRLPPHQRRPEPTRPSVLPGNERGGGYDLTAVNEAAFHSAMDNRVACSNCGRKFNPDRVAIHERSCRPKAS